MEFTQLQATDNLIPVIELINAAYRGTGGQNRWTTEAHLVAGQRLSLEGLKHLLLQDNVVLTVAHSERDLLGCITSTYLGKIVEFGAFAVQPSRHDSGIGKQLLAHAESRARPLCSMFQVEVVSQNHALIEFYSRRGYRSTGERAPYPVELNVGTPLDDEIDLVIMQKPA